MIAGPMGGRYLLECEQNDRPLVLIEDELTARSAAAIAAHDADVQRAFWASLSTAPSTPKVAPPATTALPPGQWETVQWVMAGSDAGGMSFELVKTWKRATLVGSLTTPLLVDVRVQRCWPKDGQPTPRPPDDCSVERVETYDDANQVAAYKSREAWAIGLQGLTFTTAAME